MNDQQLEALRELQVHSRVVANTGDGRLVVEVEEIPWAVVMLAPTSPTMAILPTLHAERRRNVLLRAIDEIQALQTPLPMVLERLNLMRRILSPERSASPANQPASAQSGQADAKPQTE